MRRLTHGQITETKNPPLTGRIFGYKKTDNFDLKPFDTNNFNGKFFNAYVVKRFAN